MAESINNIGMQDIHRSIIQNNHQNLVDKCDIDLLLPKLLEKRVFSNEMAKKYQIGNDKERKDKLFKGILKRGPKAFENLLASLTETGQTDLVDLLRRKLILNNNIEENFVTNKLHAYPFQLSTNEEGVTYNTERIKQLSCIFGNVNMQTEALKVKVIKANKFMDGASKIPTYWTRSKHRGAVLIINNKQFINNIEPIRNGSEVDVSNLEELFKQMHMYVETHIDKSKEEIWNIIHNFSKNPILKTVDMMFIFVMSHGDQDNGDTNIVCSDGLKIDTSTIEDAFDNKKCLYMQKKPKIFVYQVCRGKIKDYGVIPRTQMDSSIQNITLRTRDDMLIAHSTLPRKESHRDIYLGSWYIQLICEVFMQDACKMHIEEMLKLVDSKLKNLRSEGNTMQTSSYTNQGFQNCYIHPGIYYENGQIKYNPCE